MSREGNAAGHLAGSGKGDASDKIAAAIGLDQQSVRRTDKLVALAGLRNLTNRKAGRIRSATRTSDSHSDKPCPANPTPSRTFRPTSSRSAFSVTPVVIKPTSTPPRCQTI